MLGRGEYYEAERFCGRAQVGHSADEFASVFVAMLEVNWGAGGLPRT
jgi:hypothetical protein